MLNDAYTVQERNTLLPNEYDWICVAGVYNLVKQKNELTKIQR